LVEAVDSVDKTLSSDAMFIQRQELAARGWRQLTLEQDGQAWTISLEKFVLV